MKYLLLILFILLVVFLTKALRGSAASKDARSRPAGRPEDAGKPVMLACALCGLHLPRDEALPGKGGVFCSEEHRARFEAREDAGG
ncbi:PP0621 family protein [Piscinibacter sakaiensis]|uniref:PP0621 family protein n=1 Tax=Piscinibacter sakaiensis TaxID=1547922 RepID=UPI003AAF7693